MNMLAKNTETTSPAAGIVLNRAKKPAPLVLIVDDESLVRWSVSEALRDNGFDVREAADAESAIRLFSTSACDVVLLDLHLPDAQDFRVLSFIRGKAPALPVIVMTAFATRDVVSDAAKLGALVIAKPFDLDDLTRTVERALDGRVY